MRCAFSSGRKTLFCLIQVYQSRNRERECVSFGSASFKIAVFSNYFQPGINIMVDAHCPQLPINLSNTVRVIAILF